MNIQMTGDSVRAILAGTKTQTRRVIVPQPDMAMWCRGQIWYPSMGHAKALCYDSESHLRRGLAADFSPYQVGDVLWVKEQYTTGVQKVGPGLACVIYQADGRALQVLASDSGEGDIVGTGLDVEPWIPDDIKFKAAMFMPAWAARIFLRITDVRVERVREIRASDAIDEGINPTGTDPCDIADSAKSRYAELWDRLNAKRGYPWASNPWVFVYTFERATKLEAHQ